MFLPPTTTTAFAILISTYLSLNIAAAASPSPPPSPAPAPPSTCPPFSGNFTIHQYQLYPENADFSLHTCTLYIGQLWNASLGIHDPYTGTHATLAFPDITHNPLFHLGAVAANPYTGVLSLIADAAAAFPSEGRDVSGTNWYLQIDTATREVVRRVNLTETSRGLYGGFQDIEFDPAGGVYVVGTWPGTVLKLVEGGNGTVEVRPWYLPTEIVTTKKGLGGIAAWGWMLLAQGDGSGRIWRLDMRGDVGVPYVVPFVGNRSHVFGDSDAIYLPRKYNGTVLLVAEDHVGLSVFRSRNGTWDEAEYVGTVEMEEKDKNEGTSAAAAVQVGEGIYMVREPFGDEGLGGPGTAGNRTDFEFWDVGGRIDELLGWKTE